MIGVREQNMNFGKVIIFGDSYSTYSGYIPEGYAVYYSGKRENPPDVSDVSRTWWHSLISETGSELVMNNSWSGSTICYTGYNGVDCSKTNSFIYRLERLFSDGFFNQNKIDTVFVFGGTNDSWANVPLGEFKIDVDDKKELYTVLPAIGHFAKRLNEELPEARKVFVVNTNLKPAVSEALVNAAKHFGFDSVVLHDVDKVNGHPTEQGMREIKEQILEALK